MITLTDYLKLNKMDHGDLDWGIALNANMDLFDSAFGLRTYTENNYIVNNEAHSLSLNKLDIAIKPVDSLMPTVNQKVALIGEGTPSAGNKFATKSYVQLAKKKVFFPEGAGMVLTASGTNNEGNMTVGREEGGFIPPLNNYLIAWYKFDEGGGIIVNNYAIDGSAGGGLFPNLDVHGDIDIFWATQSGFGYSPWPPGGGLSIAWADKTIAPRTFGPDGCMGMFLKRMETWTLASLGPNLVLAQDGGAIWIFLGSSSQAFDYPFYVEWDVGANGSDCFIENWYFLFVDNTNNPKVVNPDGTLFTFSETINKIQLSLQNDIVVGSSPSGTDRAEGAGGAFGDTIIYNNNSLSVSEWAVWYDNLRGRYGMSARSGW